MLFFDHFKRLLAVVGGIMEKLLVIQIQGQRLMDDGVIVADPGCALFCSWRSPQIKYRLILTESYGVNVSERRRHF